MPGGRGEESDGSMHVGCVRCEQKCKRGVKLSVKSYVVVRASIALVQSFARSLGRVAGFKAIRDRLIGT
jgi:CO dehydrogenase/acetyl-CoA synthase alpha subunit